MSYRRFIEVRLETVSAPVLHFPDWRYGMGRRNTHEPFIVPVVNGER